MSGCRRAGAILLAQSDDAGTAVADLEVFVRAEPAAGATEALVAEDDAEATLLVEARRLAARRTRRSARELVDDVCVPRARLADAPRGRGAHRGAARRPRSTCAGHAGDGNMHPSVVLRPADGAMAARAHAAFGAIMRLGLDLGGTITGEHGVGLLKRDWLEAELGSAGLAAQRAVKGSLDPQNILNPGKVLSAR